MSTDQEIAAAEVAEDESLLERRLRFLSLRNAGLTFGKIAERWNAQQAKAAAESGSAKPKTVSITTVRKDVEAAKLAIIGEATREGMIAEAYSVILDVRRSSYTAMLGGDVDAAKIILATVRDQRELFGLDSPKRMSIGVGTDVEFAEQMSELIGMIDQQNALKELGQVTRAERLDMIDAEVVEPEASRDVSPPHVARAAEGATSPAAVPAGEWSNLGD